MNTGDISLVLIGSFIGSVLVGTAYSWILRKYNHIFDEIHYLDDRVNRIDARTTNLRKQMHSEQQMDACEYPMETCYESMMEPCYGHPNVIRTSPQREHVVKNDCFADIQQVIPSLVSTVLHSVANANVNVKREQQKQCDEHDECDCQCHQCVCQNDVPIKSNKTTATFGTGQCDAKSDEKCECDNILSDALNEVLKNSNTKIQSVKLGNDPNQVNNIFAIASGILESIAKTKDTSNIDNGKCGDLNCSKETNKNVSNVIGQPSSPISPTNNVSHSESITDDKLDEYLNAKSNINNDNIKKV